MRLKGKVVIVTGGARGLGKNYALKMAAEGARVVIGDVLDGTSVKSQIEKAGGEALVLHVDVTNEQDLENMINQTVKEFGRIDVLINNAAIFADAVKNRFYEMPLQEWEKMIRINLTGTFLCPKAVYPEMKKQKKGKIINVSSATIFMGNPNLSHYVASKAAVIGLTRSMAREAGEDGICVNAIAPGFTLSEAVDGNPTFPEPVRKMVVESRCFKRDEIPGDLLGTIVFLASDDSGFMTGQTLVIDGGAVMH